MDLDEIVSEIRSINVSNYKSGLYDMNQYHKYTQMAISNDKQEIRRAYAFVTYHRYKGSIEDYNKRYVK